MIRGLTLALLAVMILAGCSSSGYVGKVQGAKNVSGIACGNISDYIKNELGFKVNSAKWEEAAEDGFVKVVLSVKAEKVDNTSPVYMAYAWDPVFEWSVEKSTNSVIPVNELAKIWMDRGRI